MRLVWPKGLLLGTKSCSVPITDGLGIQLVRQPMRSTQSAAPTKRRLCERGMESNVLNRSRSFRRHARQPSPRRLSALTADARTCAVPLAVTSRRPRATPSTALATRAAFAGKAIGQEAISKAELKTYLKRVRQRIAKNPESPVD
jgi:hypothetical protein